MVILPLSQYPLESMTSEEISKMATRGAEAVAITAGGVMSEDGQMGSVRGARTDGTVTYIDGVRVRGSNSIPQSSIEQVSMIVSGTPAQYGDVTGGVMSITTKGPANSFGGSAEVLSSQFFDDYDYNLFGFSLNGPILRDSSKNNAILGFFIAGEYTSVLDGNPSNIGIYRIKKDRRDFYAANPVRATSILGLTYDSPLFAQMSDFEKVKAKDNSASKSANFNAKLEFKVSKNVNLTFGGSLDYEQRQLFSYRNSLFNSENNPFRKELMHVLLIDFQIVKIVNQL